MPPTPLPAGPPELPRPASLPSADRCLVMGVVNVTPDSFSDGGRWYDPRAAIAHGLELAAQGADIVDVGGESTRPGAQRVSAEEELRRVIPVIAELVSSGVVVSVDTMRATVAEAALQAGAALVNDVSGGLADPYMPRLVAQANAPYVLMHWRGHSRDMNSRAAYADVVKEVRAELAERIEAVTAEGVDPALIVLDPGLGFSKMPGRAQLAASRPPAPGGEHWRAGIPGDRGRVAQAVPRPPAGQPGRHPPAIHPERLRDAGDHRAGRRGRRLVRAGPRGPGERGRRPGRGRLAGGYSDDVIGRHGTPGKGASSSGAHQGGGARRPSVVLALGSNLGARLDILQGAVNAVAGLPGVWIEKVSPVYETAPVGGPRQPDYLNAVLLARTTLRPYDLLDALHQVEAAFDRVREVRWGPRTLDIDIIAYQDAACGDPSLTLPHPRAHERAFVLAPWHDADPEATIPGRGPVADLLKAVLPDPGGDGGLRRSTARLVLP
jgi:dihydropteroate synthase/2-amino-4-hydroxy-6-hydroxymethyldihydropteridine diphosphokinase